MKNLDTQVNLGQISFFSKMEHDNYRTYMTSIDSKFSFVLLYGEIVDELEQEVNIMVSKVYYNIFNYYDKFK